MSVTLDWSYGLLTREEQKLLRRLAIFAGGFTLEAAASVVADPTQPEAETIDQAAELVAKSLVVAEVGDAEPRLRLLETTRAYARSKLAESGERDRLARRHAEYYRDLFQRAETESDTRPPQASPGCTVFMAGLAKRAIFCRRSMAALPRGSTLPTSKRQRR